MNSIGSFLAAAGAAAAAITRYRHARPGGLTPEQRYLLIVLGGLSTALVIDVPVVQATIATSTDVPYLARWLADVSSMAGAFSATAMVTGSSFNSSPTTRSVVPVRAVAWTGLLAVLLMALLSLTTDADFNPDLIMSMTTQRAVGVCQLLYWSYMTICIVHFVASVRRQLDRTDVEPVMHRGMVTVVLGGVMGLLWLVWNGIIVVVAGMGGHVSSDSLDVSRTLAAAAITLVSVGLTLPLCVLSAQRSAQRRRARLLLRLLGPMWSTMTELIPSVAASAPLPRDDPDAALYRHVIEIRDAQLRLLRHTEPNVEERVEHAERAAGQRAIERPPTRIPASYLATAIANFRAGRCPEVPVRRVPPCPHALDIHDEAEWLVAVYGALTDDPIVRASIDDMLE